MGLLSELGVDTPTVDMHEVEERMKAGDLAPEGIHHAVLDAAGAKMSDGVKRGYELTFRILAGPGLGREVREIVWLPKGEDEKKDRTMKDRMLLFAAKLGLLKKERKDGKDIYTPVEGKHDFSDCLGAQCFIEVCHEEREWKKEGQAKGKMIKEAKLTFKPALFHITDPTCSKIPKGVVGAASQSKPAAAKKDDFDDL